MGMATLALLFNVVIAAIATWLGWKSRKEEKTKIGTWGFVLGLASLIMMLPLKILFILI
jgi:hypothetical protein